MVEQRTITGPGPSRDLFLPGQAIQALRDTQYRSTALAVSELIDNSVDAYANKVELLCLERRERVQVREHWKIYELAVLDNGSGMTGDVLVQALRFGARVAQKPRTIGKYGMGLPTSSVSQCRRVDVWTWQDGVDDPVHCHIDLDAIANDAHAQVPEPDRESVPRLWRDLAEPGTIGQAGTLVVWSKIDQMKGKSDTIFTQVNEEIGRIYRHFIDEKRLTIRMASFKEGSVERKEQYVVPNDPLYLMSNTSTPEPWKGEPMFSEFDRVSYPVNVGGKQEVVEVIYSLVKDEVIRDARKENRNPGDLPHGKHAAGNRGVSVVRQGREILLENSFVSGGGSSRDPQNRWWGCEVRFEAGCDAIFGVDPNKQSAANFSAAARTLDNSEDDTQAVLDGLLVEDEAIYRIAGEIRNKIGALRRQMDEMFKRYPQVPNAHEGTVLEQASAIATQANKEALQSGHIESTAVDRERSEMSEQERFESITAALIEEGRSEDEARETANRLIERDDWYSCSWANLPGSQMFQVSQPVGGVHRIVLSASHPIYEYIRVIEEASPSNEVARQAAVGIILLLLSWGNMEHNVYNRERLRVVQDTAHDWGRHVAEFISRLISE